MAADGRLGPTGSIGAPCMPGSPGPVGEPGVTATTPQRCAACPRDAASLLIVSVDHHNVVTTYLCERHARAMRGGGWSIDLETEPGSNHWANAAHG